MRLSDRQKKKLKEYAPYMNREHFFAVKNITNDDSHTTFVTGECIDAMIISNDYEIDYIGPQRYFVPLDREPQTDNQKELRAKMQKYLKRQNEDLANLKRKSDERMGIYTAVSDSPEQYEG